MFFRFHFGEVSGTLFPSSFSDWHVQRGLWFEETVLPGLLGHRLPKIAASSCSLGVWGEWRCSDHNPTLLNWGNFFLPIDLPYSPAEWLIYILILCVSGTSVVPNHRTPSNGLQRLVLAMGYLVPGCMKQTNKKHFVMWCFVLKKYLILFRFSCISSSCLPWCLELETPDLLRNEWKNAVTEIFCSGEKAHGGVTEMQPPTSKKNKLREQY